jgi:hypothetical protein
VLTYWCLLWQIWVTASTPDSARLLGPVVGAFIPTAWALAGLGFCLLALSAAARNWSLRTGHPARVLAFLDGPGPHWPRIRG